MTIKHIAVFTATLLFATAVFAGEDHHAKVEIKVISDDGDGNTHLVLDSDEMGFNLHDMQVGENQSVIDKEGRAVLITRTEDGFAFEVDGKTIDMPDITAPDANSVVVGDFEFATETDVDVHVIRNHIGTPPAPHAMAGMDGVMIVSGKKIDEATQQVIRIALETAGHESVHFAAGHGGGPHQVRVVSKVIEVSD
jgi:hypothetical protein